MTTSKAGITLVVAWKRGNGYEFARVKTADEFTEKLRAIVDDFEKTLKKYEKKPYAIGDDIEDDEYMTCALQLLERDIQKVAQAAEADRAVTKTRRARAVTTADPQAFRDRLVAFGAMEPIGAKTLLDKTVTLYAIIKGIAAEDRVAYVRRLNPMRLAKPGNILAGLKDSLTVLKTDVFAMDDRVELVLRSKTADVINKNFFDSLFFDLSGSGNEIDAIVSEMLSPLPIQTSTQNLLIERSRLRKRVRRKMLEIRHSGHLSSVTMTDFKRALDEAGLPRSQFIAKRGGKETIFAADKDADLLFYVMNDDLFNGALTGRSYAVSKKHVRST